MPKLREMNFILVVQTCVVLQYVLRWQMHTDASFVPVSCYVD